MRSLISAFVICFLESVISKLATRELSIFWLVSVAEETGLNRTMLETPTTGFLATWHIYGLALENGYKGKCPTTC